MTPFGLGQGEPGVDGGAPSRRLDRVSGDFRGVLGCGGGGDACVALLVSWVTVRMAVRVPVSVAATWQRGHPGATTGAAPTRWRLRWCGEPGGGCGGGWASPAVTRWPMKLRLGRGRLRCRHPGRGGVAEGRELAGAGAGQGAGSPSASLLMVRPAFVGARACAARPSGPGSCCPGCRSTRVGEYASTRCRRREGSGHGRGGRRAWTTCAAAAGHGGGSAPHCFGMGGRSGGAGLPALRAGPSGFADDGEVSRAAHRHAQAPPRFDCRPPTSVERLDPLLASCVRTGAVRLG